MGRRALDPWAGRSSWRTSSWPAAAAADCPGDVVALLLLPGELAHALLVGGRRNHGVERRDGLQIAGADAGLGRLVLEQRGDGEIDSGGRAMCSLSAMRSLHFDSCLP